jgi:hypothetical protein
MFSALFTIEAILKIFAMGFVMHTHSYLRDFWNVIDIFVVVVSLVSIFPGMPDIKAIRTLRMLRPLKSIKSVPSMRRLVSTLLKSIPQMINVGLFLLLMFIIFGILGI